MRHGKVLLGVGNDVEDATGLLWRHAEDVDVIRDCYARLSMALFSQRDALRRKKKDLTHDLSRRQFNKLHS